MKTHVNKIFRKANVRSRFELAREPGVPAPAGSESWPAAALELDGGVRNLADSRVATANNTSPIGDVPSRTSVGQKRN